MIKDFLRVAGGEVATRPACIFFVHKTFFVSKG